MPFSFKENREKIELAYKNIEKIQEIKLEDCDIYNEYSVIVIYEHHSDIIICENSGNANVLYGYLSAAFQDYKNNNRISEIKEENQERE